ncbi:MAG TPA: hypothetical protein VGM03_20535 [Phycisphaerae bacterium]
MQTGIRGNVTLGPTCPVVMPDQPECMDRPLSASLRIECPSGAEIRTIRSADDGTFEIRLPPGDYVIVPLKDSDNPFPSAPAPIPVTVPADGFAEVQVGYDTGIR